MKNLATLLSECVLLCSVAACATTGTPPLIFGQAHIVGISASTGTSGQAGDLTLGYKSYDLAIVPVMASQKDGSSQIESSSNGGAVIDALSVLGQFSVDSAAGAGPHAALGEFFSTGAAAQSLAIGFATNLCNGGPGGQTAPNESKTTDSAVDPSGAANPGGAASPSGTAATPGSSTARGQTDCANLFSTVAQAKSGTATAERVNGFETPGVMRLASKRV